MRFTCLPRIDSPCLVRSEDTVFAFDMEHTVDRDHLHHAARPYRPTLPAGSGARFFEESTMSHDDPTERAARILIEREPGPGIRLNAFLSLAARARTKHLYTLPATRIDGLLSQLSRSTPASRPCVRPAST